MNSFAKYKNSIDSILENSFKDSDKFKKNLSVIMGAMKYSKVLREFFTLYNEVDLKKFKDATESENYINECISYLKNNKSKLNKVTKILDKIIIDRKGLVDDRTNKVYENIDKVVFNNNIVGYPVILLAVHLVASATQSIFSTIIFLSFSCVLQNSVNSVNIGINV